MIPFSYELNGYNVFYFQDTTHPLEILVDSEGNILRLSVSSPIFNIKVIGERGIISLDQSIKNIENDSASIISANLKGGRTVDISELQSVKLSNPRIEYRLSENLIYPYYRFSGTGISAEDSAIDFEVITPAVSLLQ